MFGLFKNKDPLARLRTEYATKLEEARDAQRSGDIRRFADLTEQAEEIGRRIEQIASRQTAEP